MTTRHIYTIAGTGTPGYSGDGGPAASAELAGPDGIAVDGAGNLLICDGYNQRVRVIAAATGTFYAQAMTAGDIYTIAGDGTAGFSGDGGPATRAELHNPSSVVFDAAGNLVITDGGNQRVRVIAETTGRFYGRAMTAGDIYTVAGDGTAGFSGDGGPAVRAELNQPNLAAVDGANLLITDRGNNRIRKVTG
jgi:sugar lactone lactonase YvrE